MRTGYPNGQTEQDILEACVARLHDIPGLRAHLVERETLSQRLRPDAILHVERGGMTQPYAVECLLRPTLESARLRRNRRSDPALPLLLCLQGAPRRLTETLRREGQEFVDTAGNMFLDGPAGLVWVQGRVGPKRPGIAAQPGVAGLKLVSVLLRRPTAAECTYRELAESAGISLGAVGGIFAFLRAQGFLRGPGRQLERVRDLLALWEQGYAQQLRPRLLQGTFRPLPGRELSELAHRAELEPQHYRIGGELGAAMLLGGHHPSTAAVHIRTSWREAAAHLRLQPDAEGPVTLLRAFGTDTEGTPPGLAHPLFLRAELLLDPGRRLGRMAEVLLHRHLMPPLDLHADA